jgi:ATP-dependent Clp protease ATP-binding subunit ClpA
MADRLEVQRSDQATELQDKLEKKVIGQKRAIEALVRAYEIVLAGISDPKRPLLTTLFLGPTGVGKTELALAFAKAIGLTGITRIDCAEFRERHAVTNLIGAPKSYVGYSEGARLQQHKLDKYQTKTCQINIVLFDEIEKAHPEFSNLLLGILDSGHLNLSDGETDFTKSIIILTSNLSSQETSALIHNSGIGFHSDHEDRKSLDDEIWRTAKAAVTKHFRPELINRIDKIISFHSLDAVSLRQILDLEIAAIQERLFDIQQFVTLRATGAAKDWLLKNGTSEVYGARELKRLLERKIVGPLASLLVSKKVQTGDRLLIDADNPDCEELTFHRKKNLLFKSPLRDPSITSPPTFDLPDIPLPGLPRQPRL